MNARARKISLPLGAVATLAALGPACALAQSAPPGKPQVDQAMSAAEQPTQYPSFKTLPPAPKNEPSPAEWKAAVLALRGVGDALAIRAANQPWTPDDHGAWAERDRQIATPPPLASTPYDPATDAEVAQIRARAMAPARSR
jgi:hypothetical protein